MWLDKLKEIKNKTNLSTKDISVKTGINEKTIARIFSGDTDNPFMTTLIPICATLNCSLDDIFVDTKVVVGTEKLAELQEHVDSLKNELNLIKHKHNALIAENEILRMQLKHKEEELSAIYDFYHKLKLD